MTVNIKKLNDNAKLPAKGTKYSAGFDLYACLESEVNIYPGSTLKIGTGIAVCIPDGYFGAIFARSGLASKQGLRPANCVGVIDSDYRGELIIPLYNDSSEIRQLLPFERIAQLVILPYLDVEFTEVSELESTDRGLSGFGSTGLI